MQLERFFWLGCILATSGGALLLHRGAQPRIAADPSLAAGYEKLVRAHLFWGNLPWLVIGLGCNLGGIRSFETFFRPGERNPFVLAFFATVVGEWLLGTWWVFRSRGAEFLARHPSLLFRLPGGEEIEDPRQIKVCWCLSIVAGGLGLAIMCLMRGPAPLGLSGSGPPPIPAVPSAGSATDRYVMVFDAARAGLQSWITILVPLVLMSAGIGMVVYFRRRPDRAPSSMHRAFPYPYTALTAFFLVTINLSIYSSAQAMAEALRRGEYQVVEGQVTQFVPMPFEGQAKESFVVDGHHYQYSDFEVTPGFNNSSSHGGPIREGLQVRIADVDGQIARLEIAR